MATKKKTKTLRFEENQIEKMEILAALERRSLNNWLEVLIDKEIEANKDKLKPET